MKIIQQSDTHPIERANQVKNALQVSHPNPSYYQADVLTDLQTMKNPIMVLSQSYDEGWKAYEVGCLRSELSCKGKALLPFLFFAEIKEHVLVNNWENGWRLPQRRTTLHEQPHTILLVYVPQYYEYGGVLLFVIALFLPFVVRKTHLSQ